MTRRALSLAPEARHVLALANDVLAGTPAYLVGGALRDALLERDVSDIDLAVAGDAPGFARALADRLGGSYVLLDAERGTARVALDGPVRTIDVSRLRGGSIEADLGERDFTIDALAVPLETLQAGEQIDVIDPHSGLADLDVGVVRLVSERALLDDPLRMLRAVRLAVQLDFRIEAPTAEAVRSHAARLNEASPERQRDELVRAFDTPRAAQTLRLMDSLGLLERVFPEVTAGRGVTQPKEHHWDVFNHAIEAVAALDRMLAVGPQADARGFSHALWEALDIVAPEMRAYLSEEPSEGRSRATLLKFAALLHDVAKPETRAQDATGRIRFFGHADIGAATARSVMRRLRFSSRETEFVATMVEEHLRPGQLGQGEPPTRRALFRFFRDTGDAADAVLLLSLADSLAAGGPRITLDRWRGHVAYIAHVLARRREDETIARPQRLLTGEDVMAALDIAPGPEVGRLLGALEEAQGAGEVTDRESAISFIRRRHEGGRALVAAGDAI
jgi:putative nucleotidyltransferase with HDIG domain